MKRSDGKPPLDACNVCSPARQATRWFSVEKRTEWITIALVAVAFLAGFAANYEMRATVIRQTTVKHVARSWGKPDQTIPAGQVAVGGQTLDEARMTQCDYYRSRNTLVCH